MSSRDLDGINYKTRDERRFSSNDGNANGKCPRTAISLGVEKVSGSGDPPILLDCSHENRKSRLRLPRRTKIRTGRSVAHASAGKRDPKYIPYKKAAREKLPFAVEVRGFVSAQMRKNKRATVGKTKLTSRLRPRLADDALFQRAMKEQQVSRAGGQYKSQLTITERINSRITAVVVVVVVALEEETSAADNRRSSIRASIGSERFLRGSGARRRRRRARSVDRYSADKS